MTVSADRGAIGFAEKLLVVLDEGRFTSTYKYAVILGLMDLCLENSSSTGRAPTSVTTRQLAEKVLALYWPHADFYRGKDVLRQNAGGQAGILTEILKFRARYARERTGTPHTARVSLPKPFDQLLRSIEWRLVQMPLPKLQRLGRGTHEFFYQIRWDDDVTKSEFNSDSFDNLIRFVGQCGDYLVRLAGLLRPLVQREWANRVIRLNEAIVGAPELDEFLFGADRISLTPVRADLYDLQSQRCFYCQDRIAASFQVDHFVPWSRYPDNGIENLVAAHARCNNRKRDHLASTSHVARWTERAVVQHSDLAEIATTRSWARHPARTISVARATYLRLPDDSRLWELGEQFVALDRERLIDAFKVELLDVGG